MNTHVTAIILAAGAGTRMNLDITKQKILLGSESVLHRTVRIFNDCESVDSIIVVARGDELDFARSEVSAFGKVACIVEGGNTRAESASRGFDAVPKNTDLVAIHDAARCFVTGDIISAVVSDAVKYGAATASSKLFDSIKSVEGDTVLGTVPRDSVMLVQTPQIFRREIYEKALLNADLTNPSITDDNQLVEMIGVMPRCTDTGRANIKITTAEDLAYAKFLLSLDEN